MGGTHPTEMLSCSRILTRFRHRFFLKIFPNFLSLFHFSFHSLNFLQFYCNVKRHSTTRENTVADSGFPRGGAPTRVLGICMKVKEIGPVGRISYDPPPGSANGMWKRCGLFFFILHKIFHKRYVHQDQMIYFVQKFRKYSNISSTKQFSVSLEVTVLMTVYL